MKPLTTFYDEYIDRAKLSEQKKPISIYSSSLPTKVEVGTIIVSMILRVRVYSGKAKISAEMLGR